LPHHLILEPMDSRVSRFDYVTVGHVTRDVIEDRARGTVSQPGGSAFYSALQAARLGLRTLIITQGVPEDIEALLAPYLNELDLHVFAAQDTTTLSSRGLGELRTQHVLAWAGPMVDRLELNTTILHLAPVARETPIDWDGAADFVGVTPQGLVRHWDPPGEVSLVQLDTGSLLGDIPLALLGGDSATGNISAVDLDPTLLPESFNAAVISEHEFPNCHSLFATARRHGACVAVTAGSRPTTVHLAPGQRGDSTVDGGDSAGTVGDDDGDNGDGDGQAEQTSIPPVTAVRDDLGAGDVFAAAFFVALAEGRTAVQAAELGNAAAAVRIAGVGPDAIGRRAQIEVTLGNGKSGGRS
jgi:hypothetical protein